MEHERDVVSVVCAVISAVAAVLSVIASRKPSRNQRAIQLFDKRKQVYDEVMNFLAQIVRDGRPPEHHELHGY